MLKKIYKINQINMPNNFLRKKNQTRRLTAIKKKCIITNYNRKKISCGHEDKSHYAKGMCSNCYHKYGRTKKPWNCTHDKLYAGGMCQNCYINKYNKKRREECI